MKYLPLGTKLGAIKCSSHFCGMGETMKIMGAYPYNLCPRCQELTGTTLCVLKQKHQDILDAFKKETQSLKSTLELLETEPPLLKVLVNYSRSGQQ